MEQVQQTQQEYLQAAKADLRQIYPDLTWDGFADMVEIERRAFATYRLPPTSSNYRGMPKLAFRAVEALLKKAKSDCQNKA